MSIFFFLLGFVSFLHNLSNAEILLFFGLVGFTLSLSGWFRDMIREGTYMGVYTLSVQKNIKLGFMLFIVSEIMFFFSFF
jgi:cytochrome c oxidase subunit 3